MDKAGLSSDMRQRPPSTAAGTSRHQRKPKVMVRDVHEHFPLSAVGLALALVVSGALAQAQSNTQILPAPNNAQALPNMGQQITPLAPQGSRFAPMDPELPYDPAFLAGQGWLASLARPGKPDRRAVRGPSVRTGNPGALAV